MADILDDLSELNDKASKGGDAMKKFVKAKAKVSKNIEKADKIISDTRNGITSEIAFGLSVTNAIEFAPEIMKEEIEKAIARNDEFAYAAFLGPLMDTTNYDALYEITPLGAGWNKSISVHLAMDDIAGSIEDYANAVTAAREEMNVGKNDPIKASETWRKQIYPKRAGRGAYSHTISTRMALISTLAPFWSLLNDGNKVMMSSDRGGTPYPSRAGTHFVQKTEERIRKFFLQEFRAYRDSDKEDTRELEKEKYRVKTLEKEADSFVQEIVGNLDRSRPAVRVLNKKVSEIDANKLLAIIERIKSGEIITSRVNIGRRGIRRRVSISTLSGIDY